MENVVLGVEDDAASGAALEWVIARARSKPLRIRLVTALGWNVTDEQAPGVMLAGMSHRIQDAAPQATVETVLADGPKLHELIEQSADADLVVIGSHPDPRIRESRTESFPVSLAARSHCPVVVVPDDCAGQDGAIVVGIDAGGESESAAMFAAREATETGRELQILHAWEPWTAPDTRAVQIEHQGILDDAIERVRAAYPSVRVGGALAEAVAHDGIIANSRNASLLVLGTYRLGRESGVVLGTIHQEVMLRGVVPLCIVPLVEAPAD
jgi:nucleotide-binding universal stress UspA family protein